MPRMLRILVVEDYADTRESLRRLLALWGCDVDVAADGESALRFASQDNYDAMLLDLSLPDVDGLEVGRQIAQKTPRPVLIAYTGFHREEDKERTLRAGFDLHLDKGSLRATDELEQILSRLKARLPDA